MTDELERWLNHIDLGHHYSVFLENSIDSPLLPELTADDLKELGLNIGERRKFLVAAASIGRAGSGANSDVAEEFDAVRSVGVERRQLTAAVCTPLLARLAAPRVGLELALFGDLVSAERLFSVGLVNQLADDSEGLDAALNAWVNRIVALDSVAVRQTLETFRAAETMPLDQSLTMGLHLNQLLDASGSFKRGGAAFAANQAKKST